MTPDASLMMRCPHCPPHTEFTPPLPFSSRLLNTRTMKDTFRSFLELLVGVALDEDILAALERENGESAPRVAAAAPQHGPPPIGV